MADLTLKVHGVNKIKDVTDSVRVSWDNWKTQVGDDINSQTEFIRIQWIYTLKDGNTGTEYHEITTTGDTTFDDFSINTTTMKSVRARLTPKPYTDGQYRGDWNAPTVDAKGCDLINLPPSIPTNVSIEYHPENSTATLSASLPEMITDDEVIICRLYAVDDSGLNVTRWGSTDYTIRISRENPEGSITIPFTTGMTKIGGRVNTSSDGTYESTDILTNAYKIRAYTLRGDASDKIWSDWSEWSEIVTTRPPKPDKFKWAYQAMLSDDTRRVIQLRWDTPETLVPFLSAYEIQYFTDYAIIDGQIVPTYPDPAPTKMVEPTDVTGVPPTYTEIVPDDFSRPWYIRYRRINKQDQVSYWSDMSTVIGGSKPEIPSTWSNYGTVKDNEQLICYWSHNSTDGSPLEVGRIRWKMGDDKWVSINVENTDKIKYPNTGHVEIPPGLYNKGGIFTYQVQTKGGYFEYSDWSVERQVIICKEPLVEISLTNGNPDPFDEYSYRISSYPILPTLYFIRAYNQKPISCYMTIKNKESYEVERVHSANGFVTKGTVLYSKNYDYRFDDFPDGSQLLFDPIQATDVYLKNGESYTLEVVIGLDTGITVTKTCDFILSITEINTTVYINTVYDKNTKSMRLLPRLRNGGSSALEYVCDIYRLNVNNSYTFIGTVDIWNDSNNYIYDPHPTFGQASYKIVVTDLSSGIRYYADSVPVETKEHAIVIQWDQYSGRDSREDYNVEGYILDLPYNISISEKTESAVEMIKYSGREDPVSYYGDAKDTNVSWSAVIPKNDTSRIELLRNLMNWAGDAYIREPSGNGFWANIKVSFSTTFNEVTVPVTLDITKVDGGA